MIFAVLVHLILIKTACCPSLLAIMPVHVYDFRINTQMCLPLPKTWGEDIKIFGGRFDILGEDFKIFRGSFGGRFVSD